MVYDNFSFSAVALWNLHLCRNGVQAQSARRVPLPPHFSYILERSARAHDIEHTLASLWWASNLDGFSRSFCTSQFCRSNPDEVWHSSWRSQSRCIFGYLSSDHPHKCLTLSCSHPLQPFPSAERVAPWYLLPFWVIGFAGSFLCTIDCFHYIPPKSYRHWGELGGLLQFWRMFCAHYQRAFVFLLDGRRQNCLQTASHI